MRPAVTIRTVALGTRAAEEFRHSRPGPAPALSGGEAFGVEMLGNGLWRSYPHRLGSFDFDHDAPNSRPVQHVGRTTCTPQLGGLHHSIVRI